MANDVWGTTPSNQNSSYTSSNKQQKKHFNLLLLIGTFAGSIVGFIVGEIILSLVSGKIHDVLTVGIYFAQFVFFIYIAVLWCENLDSRVCSRLWNSTEFWSGVKRLPLVSIVAFFVLGSIFQLIYGLSPAKAIVQQTNDYIFAIDNSGSMSMSDSTNERFSATLEFIENLKEENNAAVILFDLNAETIIPFGKVDEAFKQSVKDKFAEIVLGGGTNIQEALQKSAEEYKDTTRNAMVILLSDGISSVNIKHITGLYTNKNLLLNTVECSGGSWFGSNLLVQLSSVTGGMNYQISEMSQLQGTLNKISIQQSRSRMLLDYRYGFDRQSGLFMFLRVLFIALLVIAICPTIGYMLSDTYVIKNLLPQKIGMGIASGLILEFGLYNFSATIFMHFLLALLMGTMILSFAKKVKNTRGNKGDDFEKPRGTPIGSNTSGGFEKSGSKTNLKEKIF